jgi:hypothetical protein
MNRRPRRNHTPAFKDDPTIRTHVPDELSGTVRQDGLATENPFSSPEMRTIASDIR